MGSTGAPRFRASRPRGREPAPSMQEHMHPRPGRGEGQEKPGKGRGGNSIAGALTLPASGNILTLFTSLPGKGRGRRSGLRLPTRTIRGAQVRDPRPGWSSGPVPTDLLRKEGPWVDSPSGNGGHRLLLYKVSAGEPSTLAALVAALIEFPIERRSHLRPQSLEWKAGE